MKETQKINVAGNISARRKQLGLTQTELAELLFVSNKTVSKWERGIGYPELPQLLNLSDVLGITVDKLIRGDKHGIAVAGNLLTDSVKLIDKYPTPGMLAGISAISRAVGGCMANTGMDLTRIDRSLSVSGFGRVGDDEAGKYVLMELQRSGIDVSGITVSKQKSTGFSDVMSVRSTGERTFFHHRGANAEFSPEDIRIPTLTCRMLHIGYILLLDQFDMDDPQYGTVMARFLHDVQAAGIRTSIDVVSSNVGNFAEKVIPALRYTDNAMMNEIEASGVSGIPARDSDGNLIRENIEKTMEIIFSNGIGERVIVHCPEAGFCLSRQKGFTEVPALRLPDGFIRGAVGAGDAYAAGCLYGLYHGFDDRKMLEFAAGAAACSLSSEDSVSGMKSKDEILELIQKYKVEDPS